jgi:hypothetical protein
LLNKQKQSTIKRSFECTAQPSWSLYEHNVNLAHANV